MESPQHVAGYINSQRSRLPSDCESTSAPSTTTEDRQRTEMPATRVVIVGAGMSGLAAAAKLAEESDTSSFDITIVEASSYVGGRVRVDHQWRDIGPLDMGGEFIHGETSVLTSMAEQHGWATYPVTDHVLSARPDHVVFLNREPIHLWDTEHPVMAEALHAWEEVQEHGWRANQTIKRRLRKANENNDSGNESGTTTRCCSNTSFEEACDCSMADRCDELGVSEGAKDILQCVIAQTDGGRLSDFGLADFCEDWPYGEHDSVFQHSYSVLLKHYLKQIHNGGGSIRVSSPVFAIEAVETEKSGGCNGVVVSCRRKNGDSDERIECDYVIVTVPLTVFHKRLIDFRPGLPAHVQGAVDALPMYPAIKVYMRFWRRFWPTDLTSFDFCEGILSQYWSCHRPRVNCDDDTLTGGGGLEDEAAGDFPFSDLIEWSNEDGFVEQVKRTEVLTSNEYDGVVLPPPPSPSTLLSDDVHLVCGFATAEVAEVACQHDGRTLVRKVLKQLDDAFGSGSDRPASACFEAALVSNWAKHPFVMGGYSAPAIGGPAVRPLLAEPMYDERMVFAGEATNVQPSSVQAAVETGMRAATHVQKHSGGGHGRSSITLHSHARSIRMPSGDVGTLVSAI